MGFNPPSWASQPSKAASLQVEGGGDPIRVDQQPHYVLGREAESVDIPLPHDGASRTHAAIVHHKDGRIWVIDLASTRGTKLDGKRVEANKPTQLYHGSQLQFGGAGPLYTLHSPDAGSRGGSEGQQVRASHLLVKHRDVRRPSSWKESAVTRTKEEALAMIEAFRVQLTDGGADFAALAGAESHCSSASRGGDLGWFGRGKMQKPFEEATFALQVGELSGPVFSDSGVHLILRTG